MSKKEQIDVGDEEGVKKRKTKVQLQSEQADEDLRRLIADKRNRAVIWRFLEAVGWNATVSMADPEVMRTRSGLRDAGLWWIKRMNDVDPNAFVLMQYEAIRREDDNG